MRLTTIACIASATFAGTAAAVADDLDADPSDYQAVLATLQPGDTLHLAPGRYPLLSIANLNGSEDAWITITGPAVYPRTAIIDGDPGPCCNTVEITNSSYVAIENLLIDGHDVLGATGISAKGGLGNLVHHIRIEDCSLVNHHGGQQHVGISTKTPTWGWIIRDNEIVRSGTGLYLGDSDGTSPFVGGIIEGNVVDGPIGYCMEIKYQQPRPSVAGMPTTPTTTIIRNNVFIKNDDPSPDDDRTNLLVGGFPATGPGSSDRYEIYGNVFLHNPREALLQASGRVTIHDNLFVDAPDHPAIVLRDHDLPLSQAYVYDNTIYGTATGVHFGSGAPQGDAVVGNLIFATTALSGPIALAADNLTDVPENAADYVNAPSTALASMDFYPLVGTCKGRAIDASPFADDTDHAIDFNGTPRGFEFRGAYAGEGDNPGRDPGGGGGDGGPDEDPDGDPDGDPGAGGAGCGCRVDARERYAGWSSILAASGVLVLGRRRRRDGDRAA